MSRTLKLTRRGPATPPCKLPAEVGGFELRIGVELFAFTFHRDAGDLTTFEGVDPEDCARSAEDEGAMAIGANCGKDITMSDMLELVQRYRAVSDLPIFVRPNAGTPTRSDSAWTFPHSPSAMAEALPALLAAGVAMIGGCCGTTLAHIQAFREVIDHGRLQKRSSF